MPVRFFNIDLLHGGTRVRSIHRPNLCNLPACRIELSQMHQRRREHIAQFRIVRQLLQKLLHQRCRLCVLLLLIEAVCTPKCRFPLLSLGAVFPLISKVH